MLAKIKRFLSYQVSTPDHEFGLLSPVAGYASCVASEDVMSTWCCWFYQELCCANTRSTSLFQGSHASSKVLNFL